MRSPMWSSPRFSALSFTPVLRLAEGEVEPMGAKHGHDKQRGRRDGKEEERARVGHGSGSAVARGSGPRRLSPRSVRQACTGAAA